MTSPKTLLPRKSAFSVDIGEPGSAEGWHFLTGKEDQIKPLASSVGFRYAWDPKIQQFAHASSIMLLTSQGKVAQYYFGIEYAPRDIQLGLVEASQGKIGSVVDQFILYCYHYDPARGKYGAVVFNIMRIFALATLLVLGGFVIVISAVTRWQPDRAV